MSIKIKVHVLSYRTEVGLGEPSVASGMLELRSLLADAISETAADEVG